jgi:hypothetical protein
MLFPISDTTLNELCFFMLSQVYPYYPVVINYNTDLYNTGCRPNELLDQTLWTYNNSLDIELQPLKGNSTRFFTSADLSADLLFAIQNNVRPYQSLSLRQLEYVNKKVLPTPQVQTIDKSSISYMFRYNYIKQLSLQGLSNAAIAARMGQSSSVIAAGYVGEQLYSTTALPPLPPVMLQKIYAGLLNQSGTANPTETNIKNSYGSAMIWTRSSTGIYVGTLTGVIPAATGISFVQSVDTNLFSATINRLNDDSVIIDTRSFAGLLQDGCLSDRQFIIYNFS